jgi:hypothetical protein
MEPEAGVAGEGAELEWDGGGGLNTWSLLISPRHLTPAMLLHSLLAGLYQPHNSQAMPERENGRLYRMSPM